MPFWFTSANTKNMALQACLSARLAKLHSNLYIVQDVYEVEALRPRPLMSSLDPLAYRSKHLFGAWKTYVIGSAHPEEL